jgi:hypothetical protein
MIAIIWTPTLRAQKGCQDVVYLKNGSVIRGMVMLLVPDSSVKIETADKSLFVYPMAEVARITKEMDSVPKEVSTSVIKGYEGAVVLGYAAGMGTYGLDRAQFDLINGYRFNPHVMVGLGLGGRSYTGGDDDALLIPVFLHARYTLLDQRTSPYASVSLGSSFNSDRDMNTEGLLIGANLGVSLRMGQSTSLLLGIGLEMQNINLYEVQIIGWQAEIVERTVRSSAISLNAGLVF